MKKAVLFDLYGTLIDIKTDEYDIFVYEMLSRFLSYHSVNITAGELRQAYFARIEEQMKQSKEVYPEVDVYRIFYEILSEYGRTKFSKRFVVDFAILFRSLTMRHFGIFEGLYEALGLLTEKYKTSIISDAQWVFAEPEMTVLGIDQFFDLKILSSRLGFKKPDVRLFDLAAEKLAIKPEEAIYIGDDPARDLVGSKKAGMSCILFRSECSEFDGVTPDGCFFSYAELENVLNYMSA
ncbi:MAG: HAD family hydrolase [Nitrospirota bacterium]